MTEGRRVSAKGQVEGAVEPIEVVEYDPAWPRSFERERSRLVAALEDCALAIEHIGSTAVPGLAAKPVLDILITARPFPLSGRGIGAVEALGYHYLGENGIAGRQYFRTRPHLRHLHVFAPGAIEAENHLLLRDFLRAHPEAAEEYAALKRDLARRHRLDREAYVEGKGALVATLLDAARVWRAHTNGADSNAQAV